MTKTITTLKVTHVTDIMVRDGLIIGNLLKQAKDSIWVTTFDQLEKILWANLSRDDNEGFRARVDAMVAIPDIFIGITRDEEIFLYVGDIAALLPIVIERKWALITDTDIGMFEDTSVLLATYNTGIMYTDAMIKTARQVFDLLTTGLIITNVVRWLVTDEKTRSLIGARHAHTYFGGVTELAILPPGIKTIATFGMIADRKNTVQVTDFNSGDIFNGVVDVVDNTDLQFTWTAVPVAIPAPTLGN